MNTTFPTDVDSILGRIDAIDPIAYGKTRNYIDGAVTCLSPYISRGVISTRFVLEKVMAKGYDVNAIEPFVKELCWRDYFQRVAQHMNMNADIKHPQEMVSNYGLPVAVWKAKTGVDAIDLAIKQLYHTGYMHNHSRMYTAALVCNLAQSHWKNPSQWMYYHLLDGDWASNVCSWQWVAGSNSNKKYFANQENINKYSRSEQYGTFLDTEYEKLERLEIPPVLEEVESFNPTMDLPKVDAPEIDPAIPTFVYNYYNLDPHWHADEQGNRILLLEPDFFSAYPVSQHCIDFMSKLSRNINGMQTYVGSFSSLKEKYGLSNIHFKEHPLNKGYEGTEESRDWICDELNGYYPSFFSYWKKAEKSVIKKFKQTQV
jgi:deoxyribodipyrimidine photo-lyase